MEKNTSLAFRAVRLTWIVVVIVTILFFVATSGADIPAGALTLISYPAGFLASFLAPFPVRIEGLPDPEVLIVPLAMGVLGFVQWFVVVPWVARKLPGSMRRAIILVAVWLLAEATAILLSESLSRVTGRMPRHVNAILLHAWLAIPATVAAAAGGLVVSTLIDRQGPKRWTALLAGLFFVAAAALQMDVLLSTQSTPNRIGVLLEVLMPACVCLTVGACAPRFWQEHAAAGESQ